MDAASFSLKFYLLLETLNALQTEPDTAFFSQFHALFDDCLLFYRADPVMFGVLQEFRLRIERCCLERL
jgi:hypothetical protein